MTLIFGGFGAVAAEIAAWLRWSALERRVRALTGGWQTGIGMAAITHLLFGVLLGVVLTLSIGWEKAIGNGGVSDLVIQAGFFFAASLLTVGWITFPTTALLAHGIAARRRKELIDGAR